MSSPFHSHALLQQLKRKLISLSIIGNVRCRWHAQFCSLFGVEELQLEPSTQNHVLHFRWCYLFQYLSRIIVAIEFQRFNAMNTNAHQHQWHDSASKIATQTEAKAKVRYFCQIVIIDNGRFLLPKNINFIARMPFCVIIFIAKTSVFQIVLGANYFINKLIWCVARIVQSDWLMHRVGAPNVSSLHLFFVLMPAHFEWPSLNPIGWLTCSSFDSKWKSKCQKLLSYFVMHQLLNIESQSLVTCRLIPIDMLNSMWELKWWIGPSLFFLTFFFYSFHFELIFLSLFFGDKNIKYL